MNRRLVTDSERSVGNVCIGVAGEQGGLKEKHARVPNSRCAAEERQHHFREHRLHCKEEDGGDEDGDCEQYEYARAGVTVTGCCRNVIHGTGARLPGIVTRAPGGRRSSTAMPGRGGLWSGRGG